VIYYNHKKEKTKGGRKMNISYEVINLRGEVKVVRGANAKDAYERNGLNPKEWATIRATLEE